MLRITEIFCSLQGEAKYVGIPSVFIRLTGCPLRCAYCDTEYAFSGGKKFSIEEIIEQTKSFSVSHVTVTGGEPLAQPNCIELLKVLVDEGFNVSLETSGALDVSRVPAKVHKVLDLKTPASNEVGRNLFSNLQYMGCEDQFKIVICDRGDYDWAVALLREHCLTDKSEVIFSPSYGQMSPTALADWIVEDRLPVRMQVQLHKLLWGEEKGK